jgi:hypothetical protein
MPDPEIFFWIFSERETVFNFKAESKSKRLNQLIQLVTQFVEI